MLSLGRFTVTEQLHWLGSLSTSNKKSNVKRFLRFSCVAPYRSAWNSTNDFLEQRGDDLATDKKDQSCVWRRTKESEKIIEKKKRFGERKEEKDDFKERERDRDCSASLGLSLIGNVLLTNYLFWQNLFPSKTFSSLFLFFWSLLRIPQPDIDRLDHYDSSRVSIHKHADPGTITCADYCHFCGQSGFWYLSYKGCNQTM